MNNHDPKNVCVCGRHFLSHRKGGQCPKAKPNPDGSKPRFQLK